MSHVIDTKKTSLS